MSSGPAWVGAGEGGERGALGCTGGMKGLLLQNFPEWVGGARVVWACMRPELGLGVCGSRSRRASKPWKPGLGLSRGGRGARPVGEGWGMASPGWGGGCQALRLRTERLRDSIVAPGPDFARPSRPQPMGSERGGPRARGRPISAESPGGGVAWRGASGGASLVRPGGGGGRGLPGVARAGIRGAPGWRRGGPRVSSRAHPGGLSSGGPR